VNKKHSSKRGQVFIIIAILFVISGIINDFTRAFKADSWGDFIVTIILWGVVFLIFWRLKDRLLSKRHEIKTKFEKSGGDISITDASIYSITWFRENYNRIPLDRKRIVNMSFILIFAALIFLLIKFGSLTYIISAGLVIIAAIGLLLWTVSAEREERNRLQDELKVAREMQMSLMPKTKPDFNNYDICGICIPAKEVGGDIFDFIVLNNDKLAVSIMDVSGKGFDAALSCVFLSGAYSSEIKKSASPSEVLSNLNNTIFTHSIKGKFVAFLLTIFNKTNNTLTFVNAGLPRPILKRNGQISELDFNGVRFPLGMMNNVQYTEQEIEVHPGDIFILYTDGISEAMNENNEIYSSENLINILKDSNIESISSGEICGIIQDNVNKFVGQAEQHDDIAMVVIKVA
jgi:serine phosphatase RsbU (regulator of sigma subunit)